MADIKSQEERSKNMSAIKSRDTKPEKYIRHELFMRGYRYRNNVSYVPGHPDLYLAKYHTAIFVNGCFWHRHAGCKYATIPKTRVDFWLRKFQQNVSRDEIVKDELRLRGIRRLVIWECTIKKMQKRPDECEDVLMQVISFLNSEESSLEL